MAKFDFAIAIGGAAGQGIATPGNILARICARRGLQFFSYNSYQSYHPWRSHFSDHANQHRTGHKPWR